MKRITKKILLTLLVLCGFIFQLASPSLATGGQVSVPGSVTFSTEETKTSGTLPETGAVGANDKKYASILPKTAEKKGTAIVSVLGLSLILMVVLLRREQVGRNDK